MSYQEENGTVLLRVSPADFEWLQARLGAAPHPPPWNREQHILFVNRLFKPWEVTEGQDGL